MSKYRNIGGAWEGDAGRINIKLDNGVWLNLWPNDYKKDEKHPDWKVSVSQETADRLGIEAFNQPTQVKDGDEAIDLADLPF